MADYGYLKKPAWGTPARYAYDKAHKRRLCGCGSGRFTNPSTNTCVACDPATKDRFAAMTQMQKGSKQ